MDYRSWPLHAYFYTGNETLVLVRETSLLAEHTTDQPLSYTILDPPLYPLTLEPYQKSTIDEPTPLTLPPTLTKNLPFDQPTTWTLPLPLRPLDPWTFNTCSHSNIPLINPWTLPPGLTYG